MSRRARAGWVVGVLALVGLTVGLVTRPEPTTPTTPATTPPTSPPSSTIPPAPSSSTTASTAPGPSERFDVVVVGDSLGGVSTAVTAGRLGARTLLLSPVGYFGGQASAGGVSTFDEGAGRDLLRRGGLYRELLDHIEGVYGTRTPGTCYFSTETVCPEPDVVHEFFRAELDEAGVDVRPLDDVEDVLQDGPVVTGLVADGRRYRADVVIDATEMQDLYEMVDGVWFTFGSATACIQDITWVAVRSWYPGGAPEELVPPREALDDLRAVYGPLRIDEWLDRFRSTVAGAPQPDADLTTWPGGFPWNPTVETGYRALADRRDVAAFPGAPSVTRTATNLANDSPIESYAFGDPAKLDATYREALHRTYAYLWYLRWELGITDWGVSDDLGYEDARRWFWDPLVPDELERHLPPQPYVREGRHLETISALERESVTTQARRTVRFDDSVMLGHYFTDSHGCPLPDPPSEDGLYEVPLGVFIPQDVDGFLPGLVRGSGLDRTASSSLRMQPDEIWGGQIVGYLAAASAERGVTPREIRSEDVRDFLRSLGWPVDVPE